MSESSSSSSSDDSAPPSPYRNDESKPGIKREFREEDEEQEEQPGDVSEDPIGLEDNQDTQDTQDTQEDEAEKLRSPSPSNLRATDDSDDDVSPKKNRVLIDSDDEEPDDGGEAVSPEKKKKKHAFVESDESDDDEERKEKTQKLLGSDDSDDEAGKEGKERSDEVGDLMTNIFGDDSDEEEGNKDEAGPQEEDDDPGVEATYKEDREDDPGFEWDFDIMLRDKKAEKKKKRRRRNDGIDIINDDDGAIAAMVEAMKGATKEDRISNMERKPALRKRRMLADVKTMLLRVDMQEALVDNGMLSAVSDWLSPLPDKSLPALEIRTELLKLLMGFTRLEQSVLKQSGLGKAVMMLYKHPRETKDNKEMASRLIREWARPIFQLDTDFRSLSRDERVQRDLEHMPKVKKRRMSTETQPTINPGLLDPLDPGKRDGAAGVSAADKGINRARVPRPSTRDYVVRPKSLVEGEFKGERKGKAYTRLDKTQREFMERTKKNKAKRAVTVSLEGRNLAI
ncbi:unnamed protein product [Auanema sp. JU1783]|nr:unnamed protein product [Auanema sp. JU1783]